MFLTFNSVFNNHFNGILVLDDYFQVCLEGAYHKGKCEEDFLYSGEVKSFTLKKIYKNGKSKIFVIRESKLWVEKGIYHATVMTTD